MNYIVFLLAAVTLSLLCDVSQSAFVRLSAKDSVTREQKTSSGADIVNCDLFDAAKVKLVTFDVFAALMDLTCKFSSFVDSLTLSLPLSLHVH
jgi:hypothetical protein